MQHALMRASCDAVAASASYRRVLARSRESSTVGRSFDGVVREVPRHAAASSSCGADARREPDARRRQALASLIRNGRKQMPAVGATWSDEQIDATSRYTKTIGVGGGE